MRQKRNINLYLQLIACILFLSFPLLFIGYQDSHFFELLGRSSYWIFCFSFIALYYVNTYILIPRLIFRKKYVYYGWSVSVLLVFFLVFQPFDRLMRDNDHPPLPPIPTEHRDRPVPPPPVKRQHPIRIDIMTLYIFVMVLALGAAYRVTRLWNDTEQRITEIEREKTKAELAFLKAQVHPHFLFNTLNNIYALAISHHPATAESIYKLAQIMRYFTDDSQNQFVLLQQEADCIRDYTDLQKMRLSISHPINIDLKPIASNIYVAPLLLMSFVENVFKYGISKVNDSPIYIRLYTEANTLYFETKNRIHAQSVPTVSTGIGIANTRRRLEQIYPERHTLTIEEQNGWFNVTLSIIT